MKIILIMVFKSIIIMSENINPINLFNKNFVTLLFQTILKM